MIIRTNLKKERVIKPINNCSEKTEKNGEIIKCYSLGSPPRVEKLTVIKLSMLGLNNINQQFLIYKSNYKVEFANLTGED